MSPDPAEKGRIARPQFGAADTPKTVSFLFNGKRIAAHDGETVASALYARGVRIFSRSFKYHRPRGLFCLAGRCPNCMVTVDGVPNVRACTRRVREGMRVKSQNAWPSAEHDLFSLIERLGRFLPVGFYYKTFINPPIEWSRVEGIIKKLTGLGSLQEQLAENQEDGKAEVGHSSEFEHVHMEVDIAVVGGGVAGMLAALEASSMGASVVLVDDHPELGGHLRHSNDILKVDEVTGESEASGASAGGYIARLEESLRSRPNVTLLTASAVFGAYESNLLGIAQGRKLIKLRTDQLILATGAQEHPSIFQNNDLPGIMLGRAVQRLVNAYGLVPGKNVAVVTSTDAGLSLARTLLQAGVPMAAYVDARKSPPDAETLENLRKAHVEILLGYTVAAAQGSRAVKSVDVIQLDEGGRGVPGTRRRIECDVLAVSNGFEPEAWLLAQTGSRTYYDEGLGEFVPGETKPSVMVCGDVTGIHDINVTMLQAKLAGITAAVNATQRPEKSDLKLEHLKKTMEVYSRLIEEMSKGYRERCAANKPASVVTVSYAGVEKMKKRFVCLCEDVLAKDIEMAAFEGFDDIETLKRYSTVTMGPCQGKMCATTSLHACAEATGRTVAQTGRTVWRPPTTPVAMGALSGAQWHPVKLTSMHYKHLELGARLMDMGEWKRPHVYTSVDEEYKAVREAVGIIDVGTLGRLDLRGKDSARLLDFVYTHIFSTLKVGKSRYGVICDDAGIILDDGTVTRLGEDHYFITTTTGNVEFVEQWLSWWATAKRLDAHVTNVTAGLASVNVAGPKARELLAKLTEINLSSEAFPYMNAAEATVAGIPCIMLRIGFVGETGWEIHFPAEYGEHFWDALFAAGKEFGVKAFGVEAQRILRLEKKHVIVGQDTDALSNPYEADMAWVLKPEKDDFVGKATLMAPSAKDTARKLVGFIMRDSIVAHDGDAVYSPGGEKLIGFVTSSRLSPQLRKGIGLALLSPEYHKEGGRIAVKSGSSLHEADTVLAAFYDPEGKRLRS